MYDYIIIGSGASGLLLADTLGSDSFFSEKSILILDKSDKTDNDRTWCFWEKGTGQFDDILFREWSKIHFAGEQLNLRAEISPYTYKMIRGIDFYQYYLEKLKTFSNVKFVKDTIGKVEEENGKVFIKGEDNTYTGSQVFDSRFDYKKFKKGIQVPYSSATLFGMVYKNRPICFRCRYSLIHGFFNSTERKHPIHVCFALFP